MEWVAKARFRCPFYSFGPETMNLLPDHGFWWAKPWNRKPNPSLAAHSRVWDAKPWIRYSIVGFGAQNQEWVAKP